MHVGARIVKTGLAVAASIYLAKLLHVNPSSFAAVTAIVNLKPSAIQSWRNAFQQIIVHVIAVGVSLVVGYTLGGNPLTVGLSVVCIILICLKARLKNNFLMGLVAAIFILDSSEINFLDTALNRSTGIFIGLGVALAINSLLAPPKYRQRLLDTLQNLHRTAVLEFTKAVNEFVNLEPPNPGGAEALTSKAKELLEYYHDEVHYNRYLRSLTKDHLTYYDFLEHLTNYSIHLLERAKSIRQIIPARIERRMKAGNLPVSEEFQEIQSMLLEVPKRIEILNHNLRRSYIDKAPIEPEDVREDFWRELNSVIEKWQHKFSGGYYLPALMEIALVAHEIQRAVREAKQLLVETVNVDHGLD